MPISPYAPADSGERREQTVGDGPERGSGHRADEQRRREDAAGSADPDGEAGRKHLADHQQQQHPDHVVTLDRVLQDRDSRRRTSGAARSARRPSSSPPTAGRAHSGPRHSQSQASSTR